jgi:hypothetical protein
MLCFHLEYNAQLAVAEEQARRRQKARDSVFFTLTFMESSLELLAQVKL